MQTVKRLLHKTIHHHNLQGDGENKGLTSEELELRIGIHHGIPSTASFLDIDHYQGLLAIATLDGRIKVLGGDGLEGLLVSPNQFAYKNLKFLQNQGFLVAVSKQDEIQVWNLETRILESCLQWESNITAFSVITGSYFIYIGDEHGTISVVKYDAESAKLVRLPYHVSAASLNEAARLVSRDLQPIVGILPQTWSSGNRVLIAYMNGLIILWDISESRVLFVGGGEDLKLKNGNDDPYRAARRTPFDTCYHNIGEKEISALCWASSNGSILAIGYTDGDILLWKIPPASSIGDPNIELSSNNVVKMKLSSAKMRLPVVVMHWSASSGFCNEYRGQLFVYGGLEMGSQEVLTVLSLEWSDGILRCTGRLDLLLPGSFGDMVLSPTAGLKWGNGKSSLFMLTNPGKLHLYDDANLYSSSTQHKRITSRLAKEYCPLVPTHNPAITVAKSVTLHSGGNSSGILLKSSLVEKHGYSPIQTGDIKWPLTRDLPSQLSSREHTGPRILYIAGYNDGSIRLWDATYPVLSPICVLKGEGINIAGAGASVTSVDFCSVTLSLAVGNESGLVFIYNLDGRKTSFCVVTATEREYHNLHQVKGPQCRAVFSLLNSQICSLKFSNCGAKLAVGFECGHVVVLGTDSLSIQFLRDFVSTLGSSVISLIWMNDANISSLMKSSKYSQDSTEVNHAEEVLFVLTKDAQINIVDGDSGILISSHTLHLKRKSVALSIYSVEGNSSISEKQPEACGHFAASENELQQTSSPAWIGSYDAEHYSSVVAPTREILMDSFVLLSCEDSLCLYSTKSMIQGKNKIISKVKHAHRCFWTSTLKKHGKVCGIVLLFQTGAIEIRSFPDLKLVKESSLMVILRWKSKITMENTISCFENGQIVLANGSELASISLLSGENYFRTPKSLPCLHSKVLAADIEPASGVHTNQWKTQVSEFLDNITESLVGGEVDDTMDCKLTPENLTQLESVFSRPPFSNSQVTATTNQKSPDIDRELRALQVELIKAKYGRTGDAYYFPTLSGEKHVDRQQQLTNLRKRTSVLQSEAEKFASISRELAEKFENDKKSQATNRKWQHHM